MHHFCQKNVLGFFFSGSAYFSLVPRIWQNDCTGVEFCAGHHVEKVLILVCDHSWLLFFHDFLSFYSKRKKIKLAGRNISSSVKNLRSRCSMLFRSLKFLSWDDVIHITYSKLVLKKIKNSLISCPVRFPRNIWRTACMLCLKRWKFTQKFKQFICEIRFKLLASNWLYLWEPDVWIYWFFTLGWCMKEKLRKETVWRTICFLFGSFCSIV